MVSEQGEPEAVPASEPRSPAEHKREAERLLAEANQHPSESWPTLTGETKSDMLLAALTHAVLANIASGPSASGMPWAGPYA